MHQSQSKNESAKLKSLGSVKNISLVVLLFAILTSCSQDNSFYTFFRNSIVIEGEIVEFDIHGNVEDLYCNDSILVTYNSGLDCSFTMYDLKTGELVNEFGVIGHGHNEIPNGCFGDIYENNLVVFKDVNKVIAKFSLLKNRDVFTADTIITYKLDETMLSYIVPVDSEHYLGLGAYKWNKHFVLFDTKGRVYDSTMPLYNATATNYNNFTKYLSNQGLIIRHSIENKYVGSTNNSSIISFMRIKDNRIFHIKDYDNILPSWKVIQSEKMNRVVWSEETINGFLDLSGNEKNVFALYSEEKMEKKAYSSNTILMFDWEGTPKMKIIIDKYVKQIAVNKDTLYALSEDEEGSLQITAYSLTKLN
ncbi:MAG: hypothetical protein J6I52_02640 [Prevotella sp.]|nr:hypothetical protein [Prevotella sp.]